MGERTLLVGYDLCDDSTQICVYSRELHEPELMEQTEDNPNGILDTSIERQGMEIIQNFLPKVKKGESIAVGDKVSNPINVLAYFFKKTLSLTRKKYPNQTIKQLVITVDNQTKEFVKIIYSALALIGIEKDRALVISHKQAFLYYALYQPSELWVNDVGMFDFKGETLKYYQMQVDRNHTPILVGLKDLDLTDAMEVPEDEPERKATIFENVVHATIHRQLLSSIYMTGEEFEGEWCDDVLRKLCVGRRLFKGMNLYVSGACYAAREIVEKKRLEDYILMDDNMVSYSVYLRVYADAEETKCFLCQAGTPWFQVDKEVDLIPDGDMELHVIARDVFSGVEKDVPIELEPVLGKIDKHCRINVRVRFEQVNKCVVTLKDKGFGETFPTSNRIWEKVIQMDEKR